MTIKSKLNLILAIVISFSLAILTMTLIKAFEEREVIQKVQKLNVLSQKLSLFIHETQKERGASAGFLGSKGKKFSVIMQKQRVLTDTKYSAYKDYLKELDLADFSTELRDEISALKSEANKLSSMRSKISTLSLSVKDEVAYYTNMNKKILNIVSLTAKLAQNHTLVKALDTYTNFLKSKERAGVERAVLSGTFASDKFANGMFAKWITLVAEQNAYLDASLAMADDSVKIFYKQTMNSPVIAKVNMMRAKAKKNALRGGFGVDSVEWFKTITKKINLLKKVDDEISKQNTHLLELIASDLRITAILTTSGYILFTIAIFAVILFISRGVNKSVTSSLEKITCVSSTLDLTCDITVDGKDEISDISKALQKMVNTFKQTLNHTKDVSTTTLHESEQLNNIVNNLSINSTDTEDKIKTMDILVKEVGEKLDSVEESTVSVTEDLRVTFDVLDSFIYQLGTVIEDISSGVEHQNSLEQKVSSLTDQAKSIKDVLAIISDIAEQNKFTCT